MAKHSHKREAARRRPRAAFIAAPLAVLATGAAITIGVAGTDVPKDLMAVDASRAAGSISDAKGERDDTVSRSFSRQPGTTIERAPTAAELAMRPAAIKAAIQGASTKLWASETLNLWDRPDLKAEKVGEVEAGDQVVVTGRKIAGREEIVLKDQSRWVTAGYLSDEKPSIADVNGECTNGTSVESAVSESIKKIHQAVCSGWPEVTTYGTLRGGGGDHGSGRAVDIMISSDSGTEIAEFLRENYQAFGINYIIWRQQIWSVDRSGEGWRGMEDRGSATANHFDHVHVSVY